MKIALIFLMVFGFLAQTANSSLLPSSLDAPPSWHKIYAQAYVGDGYFYVKNKLNNKKLPSTTSSFVVGGYQNIVEKGFKEASSQLNKVASSSPSPFFPSKKTDIFTVPDSLKNDVTFWRDIYAAFSTHQVVLYDSKTKFIYEKISLPKVENELSSVKYRKIVAKRLNEISDILNKIESGIPLPKENKLAQDIYELLRKHSMLKEKDLVARLRSQNGLREQFEYGLKTSGRYENDMKAVLRAKGLPEELLALVFVESLFYLSAVSHANATGPWGFLKETALNCGIHVNKSVDERLDPIKATLAAAYYLTKAKEGLSEWPLAITSYNHGYAGVKRIVNNFGLTDLGAIIDLPKPPLGYASRSYYAEFLAAKEIWLDHEKYFPGLVKENPWRYETVQMEQPLAIVDLFSAGAVNRENFSKFNFSLSKRALDGFEAVPRGYVLRLPPGRAKHFYTQVKKIHPKKWQHAAEKVSLTYKASGKESLYAIAKRFDISADLLSKKMGQPKEYRPKKGSIKIRSGYYLTSNDILLSSVPGAKGF